jgi:hypothetical protein
MEGHVSAMIGVSDALRRVISIESPALFQRRLGGIQECYFH